MRSYDGRVLGLRGYGIPSDDHLKISAHEHARDYRMTYFARSAKKHHGLFQMHADNSEMTFTLRCRTPIEGYHPIIPAELSEGLRDRNVVQAKTLQRSMPSLIKELILLETLI